MVSNNHWFVDKLNDHGDQLALVFDDNEYSYQDITQQVSAFSKEIDERIPDNAPLIMT